MITLSIIKPLDELSDIKTKKLAEFYISAGEPFVRLKQSLMRETDFDYQVLIDNWFSPSTQAKVKSVISSLNKK